MLSAQSAMRRRPARGKPTGRPAKMPRGAGQRVIHRIAGECADCFRYRQTRAGTDRRGAGYADDLRGIQSQALRVQVFLCQQQGELARWWSTQRGGQRDRRQGWRLIQRLRLLDQACGSEASMSVEGDARRLGDERLATRMQAGYRPPGQGIRGRVAVQKVAVGKIRAQLPGKLQREDPDRREAHARLVMQVTRALELRGPGIEAIDAGTSVHRPRVAGRPAGRRGPALSVAMPRHGDNPSRSTDAPQGSL